MGKMKQREAVYNAIKSVLAERDVHFDDGDNIAEFMTTEVREVINAVLSEGFRNHQIELDLTSSSNVEKMNNSAKMKNYVSGLISNWVRKDPRLNGDTKYEPKNPGSRAGQGDDTLKTLRALKKQYAGTDKESAIDSSIATRVAEIKASKGTDVVLTEEQLSKLSPELRAELGI